MFKQCADIQTADMLKLPVPEITGGKPTIVKLPPSELQRQMVAALGERAEAVRNRLVAPNEDNMLRITNDGRKLALDQRLMNPLLPDDPDSKANACVERVFTIWERTKAQRSTQMIFCDLSTPRADGFDVYNDIRDKLVARGIPKEEVQFIHDADTEAKKAELFGKVRSGAVRVLMGSTQKMGAGTNVQTRLCALHHLDCPWRPADIAQRNGRMVRQGNMNKEVSIFIYITEATFDAYSYQLVENKQKFISQIMTSKSPARSCEDLDEAALSYAEVKALAAGNPMIKEKMDLDIQVARLRTLKAAYNSQHYRLEDAVTGIFLREIRGTECRIQAFEKDMQTAKDSRAMTRTASWFSALSLTARPTTSARMPVRHCSGWWVLPCGPTILFWWGTMLALKSRLPMCRSPRCLWRIWSVRPPIPQSWAETLPAIWSACKTLLLPCRRRSAVCATIYSSCASSWTAPKRNCNSLFCRNRN